LAFIGRPPAFDAWRLVIAAIAPLCRVPLDPPEQLRLYSWKRLEKKALRRFPTEGLSVSLTLGLRLERLLEVFSINTGLCSLIPSHPRPVRSVHLDDNWAFVGRPARAKSRVPSAILARARVGALRQPVQDLELPFV
jgi:hypothetical protein